MIDNILRNYCTLRNLEDANLSMKGREVKKSSRGLFIWLYIGIYVVEVREIYKNYLSDNKAVSVAMNRNADLPKEDEELQELGVIKF